MTNYRLSNTAKEDLSLLSKCVLSGSSSAGAAISGAIGGVIWDFKLESWLGPAGTLIGTVGGAIAGATISVIVNIGVQAVMTEGCTD